MSYSKLIIKNFGKIKEAEIELSNFILFIGDNNSGKSYLMTLIYGLIKYNNNIANIMLQDKEFIYSLEEYKKIKDIVDKYININDIEIKNNSFILDSFLIYKNADKQFNLLKKNEVDLFYELLNKLLNKYKTE
ncbi:AAA family ATPase, partial [uncultured Brachyspira sp.]